MVSNRLVPLSRLQIILQGPDIGVWAYRYSYTGLIWSMKFTMLFFFSRLTVGLWQHKYIKWLGGVCAASYIAVVCTITFGCFPTQRNWQ